MSPTWYVQASNETEKQAMKAGLLEDMSPSWRYPYALAWGLENKEAAVQRMDALVPQVEAATKAMMDQANGRVSLAQVRPSRWQPRQTFDPDELWELAKSIDENDLINAIVVFAVDGQYELVAGERRSRAVAGLHLGQVFDNHTPKDYVHRLAAVGLTGLNEREREALQEAMIDARVEPAEDLARLHRMAIVENLERANLNPLEEAHGLHGLMESQGWSQRDLARHLGKSQGWVAQRLGLLTLPEAAQEAVSTRVLNLTHARALQGLPETVAPAVTDLVTIRVAHGATTREVERTVQAVKDFFDVERYDPQHYLDLTRSYAISPWTRNRLRLLRWLVETVDWQARGKAFRNLVKHGFVQEDVRHLISGHRFGFVARAAGYGDVEEAWQAFAVATGKTCLHCRWDGWHWDAESWLYADRTYSDPPCELMRDQDVSTCQRWIGEQDPELVEIDWCMRRGFERLEIAFETEPFSHVVGIEAFVDEYSRLQVAEGRWDAEEDEKRQTAHIPRIRAYYDWQRSLPREATEHVRAHECFKCTHWMRGLQTHEEGNQESVPCRFVREPLRGQRGYWTRAPKFGAMVTEDGLMLPRCEMFAYANRLTIKRSRGVRFPRREQALDWLRTLAEGGANEWRHVYRILQWLDYGHVPGEEQDVGLLVDHLMVLWEMPGNNDEGPWDEVVATLIDVVASEANARVRGSELIELVNPVTGERERFMPIAFDVARGEDTFPHYRQYPEGWPRPWLQGDEETRDDQGNNPGK
jgi:ParB family chromosome partitioning protein